MSISNHQTQNKRINNIQIGFIVLVVLCTFSSIIPTTTNVYFQNDHETAIERGEANNVTTKLETTTFPSSSSSSSASSSSLSTSLMSNNKNISTTKSSSALVGNLEGASESNIPDIIPSADGVSSIALPWPPFHKHLRITKKERRRSLTLVFVT